MPYYSVLAQITLSLGSPIIQKILKIKISKVIQNIKINLINYMSVILTSLSKKVEFGYQT